MDNTPGPLNQKKTKTNRLFQLLRKPPVLISIGLILLVVLGGFAYGVHQTQVPPPQPLQFPHDQHVAAGIACLYCHAGALTGDTAGLSTVALCEGCHQQTKKSNAETDKLAAYVKDSKPISWVPVAILPDFVFFSHRPHVAAGIACENCHAEVGKMTVAQPQLMNMGWCLSCHTARARNNPVLLTKLTDCATCHK